MAKIELLAPAGSPTTLKAAVESGADAVYMGAQAKWNARMRARNFTEEELAKAISYCHKNGVKAYVTLNTLLFEEELPGVAEYIRYVYEMGADALIVQDLAAAKIARETGKDMEIHASTQMSVHNSKTAGILKGLGFNRLVLARELSLEQVKRIKDNAGIATEVFCHGALCYSYSGKCLWSFYQTGRSGNRGSCAQLCRFPWKMMHGGKQVKKGYLTSTRDLNLLDKMKDISESGIDCVKIEGRLKDARYIREVVSAYRAAIDEKEPKKINTTLRGYTAGYLFGDAKKEKLTNPYSQQYAGEKIGEVVRLYRDGALVRLWGNLKVGNVIRSSSSGRNIEVFRIYVNDKEVQETREACVLKIKTLKRGDAIFKVEKAEVDEAFLKEVSPEKSRAGDAFTYNTQRLDFSGLPKLFFPKGREDMKKTPTGFACIIPWENAYEKSFKTVKDAGGRIIVDTPRVVFDEELPGVEKKMNELEEGAEAFMVSELSLVSDHPTIVSHYSNVTNTLAAREWMSLGNVRGVVSSIEVPKERAKEMGLLQFTGEEVELAISENNLLRELGMNDGDHCELVDPKGNHFLVKIRGGRTIIMSPAKKNMKTAKAHKGCSMEITKHAVGILDAGKLILFKRKE